ncbi:hypothetical protein ET495_17385 (plasmid) [Xylanimonas allomyrinae]|uniref:KfrA N-terminal DNA-binding domain-containing protein n=1 Tax=Xylanimonas allomyrinae TaxID=2509459 RepID=A0A4P6EQ96_9MICO|nr:hypothetical protein [Xylanimonas allomyrinae]QAY64994.1 hypothetical protein ET495_17385 [Xylanimonas allomyrinae]
MTTTQQDPAAKARQAAEDLAAAGLPVTARAVQKRAGVRSTVAADAAREHAEALAAAGQVPDVPDVVDGRFRAIWREAYVLARAEFGEDVARWAQRIEDTTAEKDEVAADLAAAEAARDDLAERLERERVDLAAARDDLAAVRERAETDRAAHDVATKELRDALDRARQELATAQADTAAAVSRAETLQTVIDHIKPAQAKP